LKPTGLFPAEDETSIHGEWVKPPGAALFTALKEKIRRSTIIAEDLGMITREVGLRCASRFGFPGMRVLQFGFSDRPRPQLLPHRIVTNTVVYTGPTITTRRWAGGNTGVNETERQAVFI